MNSPKLPDKKLKTLEQTKIFKQIIIYITYICLAIVIFYIIYMSSNCPKRFMTSQMQSYDTVKTLYLIYKLEFASHF